MATKIQWNKVPEERVPSVPVEGSVTQEADPEDKVSTQEAGPDDKTISETREAAEVSGTEGASAKLTLVELCDEAIVETQESVKGTKSERELNLGRAQPDQVNNPPKGGKVRIGSQGDPKWSVD